MSVPAPPAGSPAGSPAGQGSLIAGGSSSAALLLLADGRLPTGGHAHSGGLEEAVQRGAVTDRRSLQSWLVGRLHTTGRVDAAFAAAAASEARRRGFAGPWRWADLHAELAARMPSAAVRRASLSQGRGLLRAGDATWPAPWLPELRAVGAWWPLALGAVVAAAGLTPADAAVLGASSAVQGPAWAATRLLSLDPFEVAGALAGLAGAIDGVACEAVACEAVASGAAGDIDASAAGAVAYDAVPEATTALDRTCGYQPDWRDLPGLAAPLTDIGAEIHAEWEVRLFAS